MGKINTRDAGFILTVVDKALFTLDLLSPEAMDLMLGTWAVESDGGKYTSQMGKGPARGLWQIEKPTFIDVVGRSNKKQYSALELSLEGAVSEESFELLATNHVFCAQIARLKYYLSPGKIPATLIGQAGYWKKYYNTALGKGTVEKYIEKWNQFVMNT